VATVARYSGCSAFDSSTRRRRVARTAISTLSAQAEAPSYMEALAASIPVSWQTNVWYSKIACSVPWLISGW